ncbi:8796_t:CDS:2 [Acaulospora morrowiae]|uniref:Cytochrome c oxidase assembly factor 3 n=1 Tax=Acaulospora morrowiae TaxID=94023 RepID=A0A9N9FQK5_9GLOM|nr:2974_t:CDS:2 [Acaulospora morrowiae]CAG8552970.1 8796_t:CDS:2 [Acaulospora morrowiae]
MILPPSKYHASKGHGFTPALHRARRRFLVRNSVTGLLLLGFVGAVYSYSFLAVKQDDLGDIPLPPLPSTNKEAEHDPKLEKT